MEPARVYLHIDLLEVIPVRGRQREKIMRFVRSLSETPQLPGDYIDHDDTQRERQIKIIGDYAITYWFDAPVNTVMVVGARPADR